MPWEVGLEARKPRDPSDKKKDASALRAIAQAAINVELFTIPLYMTTMYSIKGMHQITGDGESFFKGRLWPGAATVAAPKTASERAFNLIFSVFVQEMLHLQMASNMAHIFGVTPNFNSPALQTPDYGWTCYGPEKTIIPHVVDLRDMVSPYDRSRVNLAALTDAQLDLFLAIEQPEDIARRNIDPGKRNKYFPVAPFAHWQENYGEANLPLFGTIGWMYQCYYDYMNLKYADGATLWDYVVTKAVQREVFNAAAPGHPEKEYPRFAASMTGAPSLALVVDMINAITDQGEGSVVAKADAAALLAVRDKYRSSDAALKADYPSFTDAGKPAPSADAGARFANDGLDHYERFLEVRALVKVGGVETWEEWFKKGGRWTAKDLEAPDYQEEACSSLPSPKRIAEALNALKGDPENYRLISRVTTGVIAGVTSVLKSYWTDPTSAFPSPSMAGTGDRTSICWALFGRAPDLSKGPGQINGDKLYHSCQALDFALPDPSKPNACADPAVFHTCRGSNQCRAIGGCGFVQKTSGGGLCGHAAGTRGPFSAGPVPQDEVGGTPVDYSAPGDNKCATFGGCAVPISASQILPKSGRMELFDFDMQAQGPKSKPIGYMAFEKGELVHDVAYRAYRLVMKHRGKSTPEAPPPPNDLRVAFPPST